MDPKLKIILQAAATVQSAVLKFRDGDSRRSVQAKIVLDTDCTIHCVICEEVPAGRKIGKKVHLVQKYKDDYFFIAGYVSEQAKEVPSVLSITITRAFWFVRKRKGSVTWLREKYTYENEPQRPAMTTIC